MLSKFKPLFLFLGVFLLSLQVIIDTDFGWHLRVGQYILQTKSIPYHDLFSFSLPNYPYVYHSWAGEVLIFISYKIAGLYGASIFFALALTISVFFTYKTATLLSKNKPSWPIILFSTLIFAALVGGRMRLFGLLFLSAIYYFFLKFRTQNSKIIWFIPATIALWANFHGSFILGITCLVLFTFINHLFPYITNLKQTKTLLLVITCSIPASLINPYGTSAFEQAVAIVFNSIINLQNINHDWQPFAPQEPEPLILIALVVGSLLVSKFLKIKIDKFQLYLVLTFTVLSLALMRLTFSLYIFFIPLSNVLVIQITSKIKKPILKSFTVKLAIITVFAVLALSAIQYPLETLSTYRNLETYNHFLIGKFHPKIQYSIWPYQAGQFLKTNHLTNRNLFTESVASAFLIFQNPNQKVFFYGAMDNYFYKKRSFVFEYLDLANARGNWQQKLQEFKINIILLPPFFPLSQKISTLPDWKKIYEDNQAVIFEKI